ncbi:MAG: DeoR family transcriptional regulator [Candidatus Niyogibacteria bacterium]|nr:DeoR family transcriptional regulator [Candidatus Niyogibacteria bacterium]
MADSQGPNDQLSDRAQKITEALYRVTDFFKDTEPLKWTLRKDALEILNSILRIQAISPIERVRELDSIRETIYRSLRVLELAASNSFVSETNFNVLKREYSVIMDFLVGRKDDLLTDSVDLSDGAKRPLQIGRPKSGSEKPKRIAAVNSRPGALAGKERREKILSFIRGKDWVSVGDLMSAFEGQTSGKTIQRDLIGMANAGLLLKEGDKRWRRYKAASGAGN